MELGWESMGVPGLDEEADSRQEERLLVAFDFGPDGAPCPGEVF